MLSAGLKPRVFFAGEGRHRKAMESLAHELSIEKMVSFSGQIPFGKPIFDFLDSMDLFVMPSRAEAFGRALLEAMARGCPCIGADVGGIPELLDPRDLFRRGTAASLAAKILEVTANANRLIEMSARNLQKAKDFDPDVLGKIRLDFYRFVRSQAEPFEKQESALQ